MQERVLLLVGDRRAAVAADELLPFERVQLFFPPPGRIAERGDRARPEDLADHRRVLQRCFSGGGRASSRAPMMPWIESGSGSSSPSPARRASGRTARRRAGCPRPAPAARPAVSRRAAAAEQEPSEPRRVVVRRAGTARAWPRSACRRPRPGRRSSSSGRAVATTQDRDAARPIDEVVDEVEQTVVGPVQVLEHQHQRPLLGKGLQEPPPGGERLAAPVAAGHALVAAQAGEAGRWRRTQSPPRRRARASATLRRQLRAPRLPARSVSRIPACAFTISASAQKLRPSP